MGLCTHHTNQANGLTRRAFMKMGLGLGLAMGAPLLPCLSRAEARAADRSGLAIRARVWPGPGSPVIKDGLVLARGKVVARVGPWRPEDLPPEAVFHDWRGLTVIPGLLDAHTHMAWSPETRRAEYLDHGLVALGDLAAPLDRLAELGQDHLPNGSPTARAAYAGPMLCAPGGYPQATHGPQWGLAVDSPLSAARAVEFLAKQGATLVKLGFEPGSAGQWPLLEPAVARAVVDEAHRLGLVVRCHCQDLLGLETALELGEGAGVDVIEHVPSRWTTPQGARPVYEGNLADARPGARLRESVRAMAGQGTVWCPTLGVGAATGWMLRGMQRAVGLFHQLGGRVALGTDVPFVVREPGLPLAEMALLAGCGLTPEQVLATATENAAQACGFSALGRLAPGRDADFLALGADPLTDIHNIARTQGLVLQGRVLATKQIS